MSSRKSMRLLAKSGLVLIIVFTLIISLPITAEAQGSTVNLVLGGQGAMPWSVLNIKPGDSGTQELTLRNAGSTNGVVAIWISDIVDTPGTDTKAETGGNADQGLLSTYLVFSVSCSALTTNITLPANLASLPQSASSSNYININPLDAGQTLVVDWQWALPPQTGNDVQGATLSFSINYDLEGLPSLGGGGDGGFGGGGGVVTSTGTTTTTTSTTTETTQSTTTETSPTTTTFALTTTASTPEPTVTAPTMPTTVTTTTAPVPVQTTTRTSVVAPTSTPTSPPTSTPTSTPAGSNKRSSRSFYIILALFALTIMSFSAGFTLYLAFALRPGITFSVEEHMVLSDLNTITELITISIKSQKGKNLSFARDIKIDLFSSTSTGIFDMGTLGESRGSAGYIILPAKKDSVSFRYTDNLSSNPVLTAKASDHTNWRIVPHHVVN